MLCSGCGSPSSDFASGQVLYVDGAMPAVL